MNKMMFLMLIFCCILGLSAEIVQIGSGSTVNQCLPFEPVSNYSYTQQIYHANEIGSAGLISSIAFQYTVSSTVFWERNNLLSIWIGHSGLQEMETWVPQNELNLCFDGSVPPGAFSGGLPGTGWMTVELAIPFYYEGDSSLVIAVMEYSPDHSQSTDDFFATSSPLIRGLFFYSPNPIDLHSLAQPLLFRRYFPNLRLDIGIIHNEPYNPFPAHNAINVSIGTNFSWQSDADSFDFYMGTAEHELSLIISGNSQHEFHFTEPLQILQTYYWKVIAWTDGESYPSPVWNFTTQGEPLGPPQNLQASYNSGAVFLSWQAPLYGTAVEYLVLRNETELVYTHQTQYVDSEVYAGAHYIYQVKARNVYGQISLPSGSASVHIPYEDPLLTLWQDFEDEPPFSTQLSGWTILDLDGSPTWTWANIDFPREGEPLGWMVFSVAHTVPPLTLFAAHSGSRMIMAADATTPPDNNWLISPRIHLGSSPSLSFWARSATADYGLERLKVLISGQSNNPADFVPLHAQTWLNIPAQWTQYQYDLQTWSGNAVYLAWQSVSVDALALFVDDISIRGKGGWVSSEDAQAPPVRLVLCPNPSKGKFSASLSGLSFDLEIYDIRGRRIHSERGVNSFDGSKLNLASGVYLVQAKQAFGIHHAKLIVIK